MAVIVGNETYTRWVFDPEDGERVFLVNGQRVEIDQLAKAMEKEPEAEVDIQLIPGPETKKINVVFRPLRAVDKHSIHDLIASAAGGTIPAGSGRRLQISRAVVSWDYEVPWSDAILDSLDTALEEMVFKWISWGVEPLKQDEETGQPVPLEEPAPNREQRRAARKTPGQMKRQKMASVGSAPPSDDDATS